MNHLIIAIVAYSTLLLSGCATMSSSDRAYIDVNQRNEYMMQQRSNQIMSEYRSTVNSIKMPNFTPPPVSIPMPR